MAIQRDVIRTVLEPMGQWYAQGEYPEIAQQALRKLQELRG